MIIYRDPSKRDGPPAWLLDHVGAPARDLQIVDDASGTLYGCGDGMLIGPAADRLWTDIGDGYQARVLTPLDSRVLARDVPWARGVFVADAYGREWAAPVILAATGEPVIVPSYDATWQIAWTPEQAHAIATAQAARQALLAAVEGSGGIPAEAACTWTADLLAIANHVTPAILGTLRLIDQTLVLRTLRIAAGFEEVA